MSTACGVFALAIAITGVTSTMSTVAAQSPPTADRVWAQCTLDEATVDALIDRMTDTRLADPKEIAFVVIYSFQDNDGQPLSGSPPGRFTGPVICRNTAVVPSINQVLQTDDISRGDVLDVENAFSLRVRRSTGGIEKRFCHTVDANSDCFRLF